MSNLKIEQLLVNLEIGNDDLAIVFNLKLSDNFVSIKDYSSSETLVIPQTDLGVFVQTFLYHCNRYSLLSQNQSVTEIKILLPNSNRDCYMTMESEICIFPNRIYPDEGRGYEVRVTFENMQKIITALNSFT